MSSGKLESVLSEVVETVASILDSDKVDDVSDLKPIFLAAAWIEKLSTRQDKNSEPLRVYIGRELGRGHICDHLLAKLLSDPGTAYGAITDYTEVCGPQRLSDFLRRNVASAALLRKVSARCLPVEAESAVLLLDWSRSRPEMVEEAASRLVSDNVELALGILTAAPSCPTVSQILLKNLCERLVTTPGTGEDLLKNTQLFKRSLSRHPRLAQAAMELLRSSESRLRYCAVSKTWTNHGNATLLDYRQVVRLVRCLSDGDVGTSLKMRAYVRLAERRNCSLWSSIQSDIDRGLQ